MGKIGAPRSQAVADPSEHLTHHLRTIKFAIPFRSKTISRPFLCFRLTWRRKAWCEVVRLHVKGGGECGLITNISFNCKKMFIGMLRRKKRVADLLHLSLSFYRFLSNYFCTWLLDGSQQAHFPEIHYVILLLLFILLCIYEEIGLYVFQDLGDRSAHHDLWGVGTWKVKSEFI